MQCNGKTKRRGKERLCAQYAYILYEGKYYCYYHNPKNLKKFGQGYATSRPVPAGTGETKTCRKKPHPGRRTGLRFL